MKKLRSKYFRVAVEGDTIDGREITRQDIEEMAASYDPKVYGARIWPEHFRGLIPGGPFDALGDVVACKAQEIKEGSELDGKLGLYAQVDALPNLIKLNEDSQKIYHSIELWRNFANTGKAYLFGLATTDTPASLGTQVMAFGTDAGELLAGANHEGHIEFHHSSGDENTDDENGQRTPSIFSRVSAMFSKNKGEADQRFREQEKAIEAIAQHSVELEERLNASDDSIPLEQFDALKHDHDQLTAAFNSLLEKLNMTPDPATQGRTEANGGGGKVLTDC